MPLVNIPNKSDNQKASISKATHIKARDAKATHIKVSKPTHLKTDVSSQGAPGATGEASSEVQYRTKLLQIGNKIHAAKNPDEILINLKDEIADFFGADRITIYVIDGIKRELVSRIMTGNEISEIRIPVSSGSIAGYAAHRQKLINIKNVYDDGELTAIDPELKFDKTWDQKSGYLTKQVLAVPIIFQKYLMGAMQLINRKKWRAVFKE